MTLHYVPFAYGLLLPPSNLLPNISKKIWYLIGTGFQFVQPQKSALIIKSRDYDDDLIIPAHFFAPTERNTPTRQEKYPVRMELLQEFGGKDA